MKKSDLNSANGLEEQPHKRKRLAIFTASLLQRVCVVLFRVVHLQLRQIDIARLERFGARLLEGPIQIPNGPRIAFLWAPDDVRVELIERRKSGVAGGC